MLFPDRDLVPEKKKKTGFKKIILGSILGVIAGQGLVFLIQKIVIFPYMVSTDYMEPTLKKGTSVYINRWSNPESFKRGDIILLKHPENKDWYLLRKVIGIPGDTVEIRKRVVFINGQKYSDGKETSLQNYWNSKSPLRYTEFSDNDSVKSVTIKKNELFVLGDNRRISIDSRHFGPIPFDLVIGKATDP